MDKRGNGRLKNNVDRVCEDTLVSVGNIQRLDRVRIKDQGAVNKLINCFVGEEEEEASLNRSCSKVWTDGVQAKKLAIPFCVLMTAFFAFCECDFKKTNVSKKLKERTLTL